MFDRVLNTSLYIMQQIKKTQKTFNTNDLGVTMKKTFK